MRPAIQVLIGVLLAVAVMVVAGLVYVKSTGLRGQPEPRALETRVARAIRAFAIAGGMKGRTNPLAASEDARSRGLEHFARYCALCHGNDGSGRKSPIGRGLFPKPP